MRGCSAEGSWRHTTTTRGNIDNSEKRQKRTYPSRRASEAGECREVGTADRAERHLYCLSCGSLFWLCWWHYKLALVWVRGDVLMT